MISYFFEFTSRKFLTSRRLVLFGAELQISGKFLRVETNLYLHTQREAKFLKTDLLLNILLSKQNMSFLITCILIMCFRTHFNIKVWVGGFPFVCHLWKIPLLPSPFYSQPVVFSNFCLPKAVSAAGGNANISPIAC